MRLDLTTPWSWVACSTSWASQGPHHASFYEPQHRHASWPVPHSLPALHFWLISLATPSGVNSCFSLLTTTSTLGIFQASFSDILFFSPSWEEQTQEFKPYLQEIILTDNSVSWSILKGHITLGSNKSAILLSTFSSSPFAYVDPLHCNMAYLYLELLKDSLNEYAYAAELAGLSYDLQNTIYGMYVSTHVLEPSTHQHFFILIWWKRFWLRVWV